MKKLISLLICTTLLVGMACTAFAELQTPHTPLVDTSDAEALSILDGYVALIIDQNTIYYN